MVPSGNENSEQESNPMMDQIRSYEQESNPMNQIRIRSYEQESNHYACNYVDQHS